MDSLLQFAAVAIVFCAIGLVVGLWVSKRRAKGLGNEPAAVVVSGKPVTASELPRTDIESKLDRMSSDVEYLAQHLKIGKGIYDYGSRIRDAYDDFMMRIEDEFTTLEQRKVEGREYVLRSSMLLFSLMMARVYLDVVGPRDSIHELERYIERAEELA